MRISKFYSLASCKKKNTAAMIVEDIIKQLPEVREHEPLAAQTTFQIGGSARYFFVAHTAEEIVQAVTAASQCGIPFFVLGGGSNILVSDKGFDGLVILNAIKEFHTEIRDGLAVVTVGAGENWDETVARCVAQDFSGMECLSGIPGTVGAAPVQNIGAYGQSVDNLINQVEAVDSMSGTRVTFNRTQCEFEYRTSIFKKAKGRYIITRVTFLLTPHGTSLITYHDLTQYFHGTVPTIAEVRRAVIEIRAKKGYVIMPEYECYKTAGSFFMNPVMDQVQFKKLQSAISGCIDPWYWPLESGLVKVSAACLLQSAGFSKGYRQGAVGISPKHALSIVNFENASAREVMEFAQEIKARVLEKFDIALAEEVQLVGDFT